MCHFITAFLSADAEQDAVSKLAKANLLRWLPLRNPGVERHLRPGETYYFTTKNMCNCGTALGSGRHESVASDTASRHELKERKKLRKKGWTEAKIDRHFHDQQAARQRQAQAEIARLPTASDPEIVRWLTFIRGVHERRLASSVGMLLHMYHGGLETEAIPIHERMTVRPAELTAELLLAFREDVLYDFVYR